jgi:hypothetical protein
MIVVIGSPSFAPGDPADPSMATGRSIDVARGAIGEGGRVELVGKVGDDPAGDALMLALADLGIGHAAVLRDPARPTPVVAAEVLDDDAFDADDDAAPSPPGAGLPRPTIDSGDLELALRYLPDHSVVVIAERVEADGLEVVWADAAYVGANVVIIVETSAQAAGLPAGVTVLEAPPSDPDGIFGRTVGRFAAALDQGRPGAEALALATQGAGWLPAE